LIKDDYLSMVASVKELAPTRKKQSTILYLTVWILVGFFLAALSYASQVAGGRPARLGLELQVNLMRFFLWGVLSIPMFWFSRRFRVEFRRPSLRNLLLHIPAIIFFASVHQATHLLIGWFVLPGFKNQYPSFAGYYRVWFVGGLYLGLIVATLIVVGAHALLYYQDVKTGEIAQVELKAQLAQAKLQALKMQIHPHFLFNTLHSISSLVLDEPARASDMLARLGDFLRLTLDHSDHQIVPLKEEIEFLRCYLEIEQVRFADRLTVEFQIQPATLSAQVPHMILQPVVENAVRYAIAPRAAPGWIKVAAKRVEGLLRVEVTDDGPGIQANGLSEKSGLGLSNIRSRLHQLYGKDFRLELVNLREGGLIVIMETPFRTEPIADTAP
jgi:signal transduction histidine kinase